MEQKWFAQVTKLLINMINNINYTVFPNKQDCCKFASKLISNIGHALGAVAF